MNEALKTTEKDSKVSKKTAPTLDELLQDECLAREYFSDIRAVEDDEIAPAIRRIRRDHLFLHVIAEAISPKLPLWMRKKVLTPLIRLAIQIFSFRVNSIMAFQARQYLFAIRPNNRRTIRRLSFSFAETFDKNLCYTFISNHRDIIADPTLIIMGLRLGGKKSLMPISARKYFYRLPLYLSAGNNLYQNGFVSRIMHLNGTFVVRRDYSSRRGALEGLRKLSSYIHYLHRKNRAVWIAQRQGRAKDGNDATDKGVISMLTSVDDNRSFHDIVNELRIAPVSLTYEYDPCDVDKALELAAVMRKGKYIKRKGEDVRSVIKGITGKKGNVHVRFGAPITLSKDCHKDTLLGHIDRAIYAGYRPMATQLAAYRYLCRLYARPLHSAAEALLHEHTAFAIEEAHESLLARVRGYENDSLILELVMRGYAFVIFNHIGETMPPCYHHSTKDTAENVAEDAMMDEADIHESESLYRRAQGEDAL